MINLEDLTLKIQSQGGQQAAADVKSMSNAIDDVKGKTQQATGAMLAYSTAIASSAVVTGAATAAIYEIIHAFIEFSGLKFVSELQQVDKQLSSMVKNSDVLLTNLREIGEQGFGTDNAEKLAAILARAGGSAEDISNETRIIAHFASGSGTGTNGAFEIASVLNKIRETPFGTDVSARALKNLPGVNIKDLLGDALGLKGNFQIGQAEQIMSSLGGERSFALILDQLDKKFGGASLTGSTLLEKITVLENSLKEVFVPVITSLINVIIPFVELLTSLANGLHTFLDSLSDIGKVFALVLLVFVPLVSIVGVARTAIQGLVLIFSKLNTVLDHTYKAAVVATAASDPNKLIGAATAAAGSGASATGGYTGVPVATIEAVLAQRRQTYSESVNAHEIARNAAANAAARARSANAAVPDLSALTKASNSDASRLDAFRTSRYAASTGTEMAELEAAAKASSQALSEATIQQAAATEASRLARIADVERVAALKASNIAEISVTEADEALTAARVAEAAASRAATTATSVNAAATTASGAASTVAGVEAAGGAVAASEVAGTGILTGVLEFISGPWGLAIMAALAVGTGVWSYFAGKGDDKNEIADNTKKTAENTAKSADALSDIKARMLGGGQRSNAALHNIELQMNIARALQGGLG